MTELTLDPDHLISTFDLMPEYKPTIIKIVIDVNIPYGELKVSPILSNLKFIF